MSKRIWIVGGDSGMGYAASKRARELSPFNVLATGHGEVDVRDSIAVGDYVRAHAPFDQVLYCAGINKLAMLGSLHQGELVDTFDVNVLGFIRVVDALAAAQAWHPTSVVALCSDASRTAMRGSIGYCASKAALVQAVRCAAREMAPAWRVNGISPSVVDGTAMTAYIDQAVPALRGWTPEQAAAYEKASVPMGRRARIDEVVDLAFSILDGPEFMTGSIVDITGGK